MWIPRMHVAHWITSGSLHTTVLVHQIIHGWDRSRAPDWCWRVHTSVCKWAGDWCRFRVTSNRGNGWRRGWGLSLLWCWRFIVVSFFGLLLLPALSSSVFEPDLKTGKKSSIINYVSDRWSLTKWINSTLSINVLIN